VQLIVSVSKNAGFKVAKSMMLAAALWEDRTGKCSWAGKALPSTRLNFSRTSTSHQSSGYVVLAPREEDGRHQRSSHRMISACPVLSSSIALGWLRAFTRSRISIAARTNLREAITSRHVREQRRALV
jgi:hypothetical protein